MIDTAVTYLAPLLLGIIGWAMREHLRRVAELKQHDEQRASEIAERRT